MLIFLHGPDSYRIHERLAILRQGFQTKYDTAGLSIQEFAGNQLTVDQLRTATLSVGLFTKQRLVIIKNVFGASEPVQQALSDVLKHPSSDTIMIVTAQELPKKATTLSKHLLQADRVEEYTLLNETQLRQWIQQQLKQHQVTITTEAMLWLIQAVGSDLWQLHNVLEQLAHWNKTITLPDVKLFVQSPLDDNIFHLTDALTEHNSAVALRLVHEQLAAGSSPFYIITMLARQLTILIRVKESNGQDTELHPFVIKKAQRHVQRLALTTLEQLLQQLLEIDLALKTTPQDAALLLDRFIVQATLPSTQR